MNYRVAGTTINADYIDRCGFFIGNDGRELTENLKLVKSVLDTQYNAIQRTL
jgi:hypothetical protein